MEEQLTPLTALDLAVTRKGGQAAMARLCGVSQTAVWKWLNEGKQLPAEHVLKAEAATGVSRHDLRPDIYPRGLQDGVPFTDDPLVPPLVAEDGGGDQGAPLAPSPGQHSCDQRAISQPQPARGDGEDADDDKLQAAGAGR